MTLRNTVASILLIGPLSLLAAEQDPRQGQQRQAVATELRTPAPAMSPASDADDDSMTLATREAGGNTAYDAGTCYVVNALVQSFCQENPDDASCRYHQQAAQGQ